MKIGIVIPARMSSKRLPGKVLMKICGMNPIERIIKFSLNAGFKIENIVVSTSTESSDIPLYEWCKKNNINCFRGDLNNVAKRFYDTAVFYNFRYAIRINADNVLVNEKLLKELKRIGIKYNFISNVPGRTFPYGMSLEMINISYMKKYLSKIYSNREFFEHIFSFFYEIESNNHYYIKNNKQVKKEYINMSLDTYDDFRRLEVFLSKKNNLKNLMKTINK